MPNLLRPDLGLKLRHLLGHQPSLAGIAPDTRAIFENRRGSDDYNLRRPLDSTSRRGGTRKIADLPAVCRHREHNPPSMQVFTPGVYEHTCPGCGASQTFRVDGATF